MSTRAALSMRGNVHSRIEPFPGGVTSPRRERKTIAARVLSASPTRGFHQRSIMKRTVASVMFVALLAGVFPAAGRAEPALNAAPAPQSPASARRFESIHEGFFGGHKIHYRAVVAEYFIKDAAGKRTASLIATSYLRTDVPKGAERPVLFVFNGGPGSASLWLHIGLWDPAGSSSMTRCARKRHRLSVWLTTKTVRSTSLTSSCSIRPAPGSAGFSRTANQSSSTASSRMHRRPSIS